MKRLISILLAVALLVSLGVFAYAENEAVQFAVGSVSVDAGARTATVPISLTKNAGHAGADIKIVSDLTITDIEEIKVSAVYNVAKGLINWSYSTNRTTVGEILRVTFAIPEDAQPGDTWDVGLTVTMLRDASMNVLSSSVTGGRITVKSLSDLTVSTLPSKVSYTVGDTLDTTGLALTAALSDGSTSTITSGFACSPMVLTEIGTQVITVTYGGKTTEFSVTVEENIPVNPDAPTFTVSTTKGILGQTVDITVSIANNPGIISTSLSVNYDASKLTLTKVTDGGLLGTGTFIPGNKLTDVPYTVLWEDALASGNYTEDGVLVTFTFTIKEDAELGETPITLSYTQGSTLNYDLDPVAFTVINGCVEITDRTPGDADGDGEINLRDVIIMRRWLAGGFDVTLDEANADVDGDGDVDLRDVILIKRYLAGGWDIVLI